MKKIVEVLNREGQTYNVLEEPIDYKSFRYEQVIKEALTEQQLQESSIWLRNSTGDTKKYEEVAEEIRQQDPVVLQTSVVKIQ